MLIYRVEMFKMRGVTLAYFGTFRFGLSERQSPTGNYELPVGPFTTISGSVPANCGKRTSKTSGSDSQAETLGYDPAL